jgi:hypothetical protein
MKTIILLTVILLSGCSSLNAVLHNNVNACLEAQKSISKDSAMTEIARLNAIQEIAKNANDETKRTLSSQINNRRQTDIICK